MKHSDLLGRVQESATLKMTRMAREIREQGHEVISLSIGEPDFNTPEAIKDAAKSAMDNNITKYPPVNGFPELRKAISDKLQRENNASFSPEQIVVSTGAKQSLINIVLATVNPGDEVVIPAPFWVSYPEMVNVAGGTVVEITTDIQAGFKVSPNQLENALTAKSKLVIISSPSNPTGAMYTPQEMEAIAAVIARYPHVTLISDEIYEYITYGKDFKSFGTIPSIKDQLVIVNGVSKGFAMTGWRLGFCAAPLPLAQAMTKIQGQFTSGASSISQMAAKKAFEMGRDTVRYMVESFEERRDYLVEALNEIEGIDCLVPDGAFYVYPYVQQLLDKTYKGQHITTDDELCMYFLEEGHIAMVPGSAFGTPGYLRLSYATDMKSLQTAVSKIKHCLSL